MPTPGVDWGPFASVLSQSDVVAWLGGYLKIDILSTPLYPGTPDIVYAREHNRIVGAIADIKLWIDEAGGAAADVIDVSRAPYNVVANVSTVAQALANRVGIQAALVAAKAAHAAGTPKRVRFPFKGDVYYSFSRGVTENVDAGRCLIDWPGAVIEGMGKNVTFLRAISRKDTVGRRASFAHDTTASGQRVSVSGNVVTLNAGQGNNFLVGYEVYFSPNADGSAPRTQTANITIDAKTANTITLSDITDVSGFINGDFIFVKNRLTLTSIPDALNFSVANGASPQMEIYASVNVDGSSPRAGAAPVVGVNTGTGVLTLGQDITISGFADNDHLFVNVAYCAFEHRVGSDSTSVVYDVTFRDLTLDAEFYGATSNPTLAFGNGSGDVINYNVYGNNSVSGLTAIDYTVLFERVHLSDAYDQASFYGGTSAATHVKMVDSSTSGGAGQIFMTANATAQEKSFEAYGCEFFSTHPTQGSHNLYLNPVISAMITGNRFRGVPSANYGFQNWGSADIGPKFCIVANNTFEGLGNGVLTNEHGGTVFTGNIFFNAGAAIHVRSSCTITGGRIRKTGTSTALEAYADVAYNSHVRATGIDFDFAAAAYTGISISLPSKWTVSGCTWTAHPATQAAGEPLSAADGSICIAVQTTANDASQPAELIVGDNIFNFNTTTGTVQALLLLAAIDVRFHHNLWKGRTPTGDAGIRTAGTLPGNGRMRFESNRIDSYGGGGIKIAGTFSGSPSCVIQDNGITTHLSGRDCIELSYTNSCPTRVNNNWLNSVDAAIVIGANVPAMNVTGVDNEIVAGTIVNSGNRQGLRLRAMQKSATVSVTTASVTLDPNFDTHELVDGGSAITLDTINFAGAGSGAASTFDGALLTLIFTSPNITLGAGGNITAAGAARATGRVVVLKYNHTLGKLIEVGL